MTFSRQEPSKMGTGAQYPLGHQTDLICSDHSQVGSSIWGLGAEVKGFPRTSWDHRIWHFSMSNDMIVIILA